MRGTNLAGIRNHMDIAKGTFEIASAVGIKPFIVTLSVKLLTASTVESEVLSGIG